ncbi:MAG: hypothetical protein WCI72_03150 [archaeon]
MGLDSCDDRPRAQPVERLLGIDLPNGLTYIGRTTCNPGNSTIYLNDYIVVESMAVRSDISSLYNAHNTKIRNESLRIDWKEGLAMRIGQFMSEIRDNPSS